MIKSYVMIQPKERPYDVTGAAVKIQPNVPPLVEWVPAYHVDVVAYALMLLMVR